MRLDAAADGFLGLGAFPSSFPEPREPAGRAKGLVEADHEAPGASSVQGALGKCVICASQSLYAIYVNTQGAAPA